MATRDWWPQWDKIENQPNVANAIPGDVRVSLDVRHACDAARTAAVEKLYGRRRSDRFRTRAFGELPASSESAGSPDGSRILPQLANAVQAAGYPVHRMSSGAGHDAMIVAPHVPSTMLFIRSPGGVSHIPKESVNESDVAAALTAGLRFFHDLESAHWLTW